MDNTILIALLSLAGTLGGSYMGVRQSNKLVNFRIDALEKRFDEIAKLAERTAKVEASAASAHKRIDDHKKEGT